MRKGRKVVERGGTDGWRMFFQKLVFIVIELSYARNNS